VFPNRPKVETGPLRFREGLERGGKALYDLFKHHRVAFGPRIRAILDKRYADKSLPPPRLNLPPYTQVESFMLRYKNLIAYTLGSYREKYVHIEADGSVWLADDIDDLFEDNKSVSIDGGERIMGFCFGSIASVGEPTGTRLIILEDERIIMYTPDEAAYPGWSGLEGRQGTLASITREEIVVVTFVDVDVEVVYATEQDHT
jgi:hypothetical protein